MELSETIRKINSATALPGPGEIPVRIAVKSLLADTCTPVSLYLRLRDRFPGAVLLESADNAEGRNSRSFIAINPVAEISGKNNHIEIKVPSCGIELQTKAGKNLPALLESFRSMFGLKGTIPETAVTGLIGYMNYNAIQYFEDINLREKKDNSSIPFFRYAIYRTIIAFDPLRHSMHIIEQLLPGDSSGTSEIESLIAHRDVPQFRFKTEGKETSSDTDSEYLAIVEKGIAHCRRGDVFQIVLSRKFRQQFSGDEFNVYRALRTINPSPYLFFADYGDYRIFGSSPEAQLVIRDKRAIVHPIAGTFRRTGYDDLDRKLEEELLADPKENAEHIMLVDLARNDLARSLSDIRVDSFREVHRYSHVIHLVSKVSGAVPSGTNSFRILGNTFPAGTLSGAPKIRAMQIIDELENADRGYYGGCIGLIGFDGTMNQAIMIRSFLSQNGELHFQAGAGIVVNSIPENELKEVANKLEALRKAIAKAETISN